MKEKKHIDSLFKERFENFEPVPSPRVWATIEKQLHPKKKERTVIPLWWKVAGVAALIALLISIGNFFSNDKIDSNEIVTEDNNLPDVETQSHPASLPIEKGQEQHSIIAEGFEYDNSGNETTNDRQESNGENANNASRTSPFTKQHSAVAVETTSEADHVTTANPVAQTGVNARKELNSDKKLRDPEKEAVAIGPVERPSEENKELPSQRTENAIAGTKTGKEEKGAVATDSKKPSLLEEVAKQEAEKNTALAKAPEQRWSVAPTVGPVYYNSFGDGSSIDPSFSDNVQEGDINFSYGVQVSYAISKRLSVRSGITNVDLSYSTGGIEVGTGPVSAALKTVDYGGRNVVVSAFDAGALNGAVNVEGNPFMNVIPKATGGNAILVQNISYFEVPVELKYALVDTKLGVNVIGGMSTLFLGDNEIAIESNNFNTVLGEANNLNEVSFTTNVGIGVDYKISKNLLFNIEPIFKYQLNPYSDTSVDFRPYYFGVYSGLNFRF
jgi:hypothetical protein